MFHFRGSQTELIAENTQENYDWQWHDVHWDNGRDAQTMTTPRPTNSRHLPRTHGVDRHGKQDHGEKPHDGDSIYGNGKLLDKTGGQP
jgi:hypothetical protein